MKWMIKGAASGMKWPIILSSLTTFPSQFLSIPSYFTSFGRVFWYPLSRSSCLLCKEASEQLCPLYGGLSLFTYTVRSLIGFGCSLSHF
jgi:hypothetical protein